MIINIFIQIDYCNFALLLIAKNVLKALPSFFRKNLKPKIIKEM